MDLTELNFDIFQDMEQVLTKVTKTLSYQECLVISSYILSIREECLKLSPGYQMPIYLLEALEQLTKKVQYLESSEITQNYELRDANYGVSIC